MAAPGLSIISVIDPGLGAIRNCSMSGVSVVPSVIDPGLGAIRNYYECTLRLVPSVIDPGLGAIRNRFRDAPMLGVCYRCLGAGERWGTR